MSRLIYLNRKIEADGLKKLDMRWLKKQGLLRGSNSNIIWTDSFTGEKDSIGIDVSMGYTDLNIRLKYTQTDFNSEKRDFDYKVLLTTTPCHYGGERYWFICPLTTNGKYCGRRVGVLYKAGDYFGCRNCYKLTYKSRNKNRKNKLYPLFAALLLDKKVEDLEHQIKRKSYAGKPTKKQRKLYKIYKQQILLGSFLPKYDDLLR